MNSGILRHRYGKPIQALVAAVASILGVLILVAIMDVWPILPNAYPTILTIAGVGALIGVALKPLPWYLTALLGAVVGLACAFGVATYAVSRI